MIVSSYMPFPAISWWTTIIDTDVLILDKAEHFEKMSFRNRYEIAGANGKIMLSIPIEKGRNNRASMKDIKIAPGNWQTQHWRTIMSAYGRAPFFEYYSPYLQKLFETNFTFLIDFNVASVQYVEKSLKIQLKKTFTEEYVDRYDSALDLRIAPQRTTSSFPQYFQPFANKTGFLPNLSILDLLFSEGPAIIAWIKENKEFIV